MTDCYIASFGDAYHLPGLICWISIGDDWWSQGKSLHLDHPRGGIYRVNPEDAQPGGDVADLLFWFTDAQSWRRFTAATVNRCTIFRSS
ncbi:hypothetical protein KCP75_04400 [Salmonella enterica subsp. enterica]|nr:hypothetical protein KCP75_04400 [Salmonella enterica subsp. enterica]